MFIIKTSILLMQSCIYFIHNLSINNNNFTVTQRTLVGSSLLDFLILLKINYLCYSNTICNHLIEFELLS